MKSNKELLKILLDNIDFLQTGLCGLTAHVKRRGIITNNELIKTREYISRNRPSCFSSIEAFKKRRSDYYWECGKTKPRIKWLKQHIKKLS